PQPTPSPTPQPTPSPTPPTLAELNNMTKRELQDIARNYGTRYTGTKEAIINGIINQ
ncbi:MAG TPA: cellulose-binding protein, partial [Flavobacterium sp.]|nr:cellulose-binding protein [Flavobacterium sp.]